jgi:hypothetical protein
MKLAPSRPIMNRIGEPRDGNVGCYGLSGMVRHLDLGIPRVTLQP